MTISRQHTLSSYDIELAATDFTVQQQHHYQTELKNIENIKSSRPNGITPKNMVIVIPAAESNSPNQLPYNCQTTSVSEDLMDVTIAAAIAAAPVINERNPTELNCPHCKVTGLSVIKYERSTTNYTACGLLFFTGILLPLSPLMLCLNQFKNVLHSCASCGKLMAVSKKA